MADCFGFTLDCVASNTTKVPSLEEKIKGLSLLDANGMKKIAVSLGINLNDRFAFLPLNGGTSYSRYKLQRDGAKLTLKFDADELPTSFDHYWLVRNVFSTLALSLREIDPDCEVTIVGYDENEYDADDFFEDDYDYGENEIVGRHSYIFKPKGDSCFYYWFTRNGEPQDFDMPDYEDIHPDFKCAELKGGKRGQPVSLASAARVKTKSNGEDKKIRSIEKALKDDELDYWLSAKQAKGVRQRGHFKICVDGIPGSGAKELLDALERKLDAKAQEVFQSFYSAEDGHWGFRLSAFDHCDDENVMVQFDGIEQHGDLWTSSTMEEFVFKLIERFIEECIAAYPKSMVFGFGCFDAEADYSEWISNNSAIIWLKKKTDSKAFFQVCISSNSKGQQAAKLAKNALMSSIRLSSLSYPALFNETMEILGEVYESLSEDTLNEDEIPTKPSKEYGCKYLFPVEW